MRKSDQPLSRLLIMQLGNLFDVPAAHRLFINCDNNTQNLFSITKIGARRLFRRICVRERKPESNLASLYYHVLFFIILLGALSSSLWRDKRAAPEKRRGAGAAGAF
jgi:hypothetical protein